MTTQIETVWKLLRLTTAPYIMQQRSFSSHNLRNKNASKSQMTVMAPAPEEGCHSSLH
jgi:hypothetical protein